MRERGIERGREKADMSKWNKNTKKKKKKGERVKVSSNKF